MNTVHRIAIAACGLMVVLNVFAQDDDNIFAQYREMFGDDNPAELVDIQGEELWYAARGPNKVSLEACDLGLGPGVIEGAYAQLPKYFEDVDRVMDAESRLVHCMVTIQGFDRAALMATPFAERGQEATDIEALTTYVAGQSSEMPVAVSQVHAKEKLSYKIGKQLFNYRAGPYDFSCATCHSQPGKRIRLQALPNLSEAQGARASFTVWPAYRISQGAVRTIGWRMQDCARQQRLPQMVYGSDAMISLITYMGVEAGGAEMAAPGLKR